MSKLDTNLLRGSIEKIVDFSKGNNITLGEKEVPGKKRNFLESIELQITLKNYDVKKDKRFSGAVRLPNLARRNMKLCVIGTEVHCQEAREAGIDALGLEDLKKYLVPDKKLKMKMGKRLAQKYTGFLASASMVRQIPKYLGPSLQKAGKFPAVIQKGDTIADKIAELKSTVRYQLKKRPLFNVVVGHVEMDQKAIEQNTRMAINYLVSLLKKHWQNIKVAYLKSSMGPSFQIYF